MGIICVYGYQVTAHIPYVYCECRNRWLGKLRYFQLQYAEMEPIPCDSAPQKARRARKIESERRSIKIVPYGDRSWSAWMKKIATIIWIASNQQSPASRRACRRLLAASTERWTWDCPKAFGAANRVQKLRDPKSCLASEFAAAACWLHLPWSAYSAGLAAHGLVGALVFCLRLLGRPGPPRRPTSGPARV